MGSISLIQTHSRRESLSAATESWMVSILLRVIMGKGSEQNMLPDHTYSNHCITTQSLADCAVFNLRPLGCHVAADLCPRNGQGHAL